MRLFSLCAAFVALLSLSCAQAGGPILPGPGLPVASGGGYTGPGDVVSGAIWWVGLRCYNNAYSGNVADITDSATGSTTGTRLVCSSGAVSAMVSASACTFVTGNACSPLATTCASACNVVTLYDQSGNSNCSGPCNVTQSTNADRPPFTKSGCSGLSGTETWCLSTSRSAGTNLQGSSQWSASNQAQPYTGICAADFTSVSGGNGACAGLVYSDGYYIGVNTTPQSVMSAGTAAAIASISTGTWYSIIGMFNGASSSAYMNGSSTTGLSAGSNAITNGNSLPYIGTDVFGDGATMNFVEAGAWAGSFSAGNQSAMNNNIRSYWGF